MKGEGLIKIEMEEDESHVKIQINDTGKGIEPELISSIFKPGVTSKKRGWGLGLSLTKRIIEEIHFGKIWLIHSNKGKTIKISINDMPIIGRNTQGVRLQVLQDNEKLVAISSEAIVNND